MRTRCVLRVLAVAGVVAVAGCASRPMSDSDRAVLMQYWANQQAINMQTMSALARPVVSPTVHCSSVATGYVVNTNCY